MTATFKVYSIEVACPTCGARPGSRCISRKGTPCGSHDARMRLVRKGNAQVAEAKHG
jgi:hypothetical protein